MSMIVHDYCFTSWVVNRSVRKQSVWRACAAVCMTMFHCAVFAATQTNSNAPPRFPTNRYLLVIETSRSMHKRADGLAQSIQDLLGSALASQARRGDSLGLWTYNEDLHTGVFPLQKWSPESEKEIVDKVAAFLKEQKLEKAAKPDKVMPTLARLVGNSPFITVILACTGDEEIHGTPFDQRINNFFRTQRVKQQELGKPFIVALRAQGGQFVECSMNPAPWPAELPALPRELSIPLPPPVAATPSKSTSSVPPLIISGKKPARSPAVSELALQPTNPPTGQSANSALVVSSHENSSSPTSSTAQAANIGSTTPDSASSLTATPASSQQNLTSPAGNQSAGASATDLIAAAQPAVRTPDPQSSISAASTSNSKASSVEKPPSSPVADKVGTTSSTEAAVSSTSTAVKPTPAPVKIATTPSSSGGIPSIVPWVAGASSLLIAGLAVWIWRRRSRPVQETSLITESIDRRKS